MGVSTCWRPNLKHLKKKRRPQVSNPIAGNKGGVVPTGKEDEQSKIFKTLADAFSLASLDNAVSTFRQANGDPNKAIGVLAMSSGYNADDPSTSSSSGSEEGLEPQRCWAWEVIRSIWWGIRMKFWRRLCRGNIGGLFHSLFPPRNLSPFPPLSHSYNRFFFN